MSLKSISLTRVLALVALVKAERGAIVEIAVEVPVENAIGFPAIGLSSPLSGEREDGLGVVLQGQAVAPAVAGVVMVASLVSQETAATYVMSVVISQVTALK